MNLTRREQFALGVMLLATLTGSITQTAMTTALPQILLSLQIPVSMGQWLTSIYMLVMGIIVPISAYLIQRFSSKQLLFCSILSFLLGSLLACFAPNFPCLVAGRFLEALGTGALMPLTQVTIFELVSEEDRAFAMGFVGLTIGFAPAIGPTLAGLLTDAFGWRSIFAALSCIALVVLLALCFLKSAPRAAARSTPLDPLSLLLSTLSFSFILLGFGNFGTYGLNHPLSWLPILIGAGALALFARRQLRIPNPLLQLRVFQNQTFTVGTAMMGLFYFAFLGMGVILPLYVQSIHGLSATSSGLVLLPGAVAMAAASMLSGALCKYIGIRKIAIGGSLLLLVGTLAMLFFRIDSPLWYIMLAQTLRQTGIGALIMPVTTWSLTPIEPRYLADATAINGTVRQVIGAVGSALMVTILSLISKLEGAQGESLNGVHVSIGFSGLLCLVCLLLSIRFIQDKDSKDSKHLLRHGVAH